MNGYASVQVKMEFLFKCKPARIRPGIVARGHLKASARPVEHIPWPVENITVAGWKYHLAGWKYYRAGL